MWKVFIMLTQQTKNKTERFLQLLLSECAPLQPEDSTDLETCQENSVRTLQQSLNV